MQLTQSQQFDILLADLNIGQPGDGFTVVSAMRRSQPRAHTFILTGYPELSERSSSEHGLVDHVPKLILEIADRIENHPEKTSKIALTAAAHHGMLRQQQGYTIPMLLVESSILERTVAALLEEHLLAIDISTLIPDMHQISEAINCAVETSVRTFLGLSPAS